MTQEYYTEAPQAYPEDAYYPQQQAADTDTITEIAEQVVSEKFEEFNKTTGDISSFKNSTQDKLSDLDQRLKRIEKILDTLQSSILKRVGDYVTDVRDIKSELIETQKTFTKLVPDLRKKTASHSGKHHKKR